MSIERIATLLKRCDESERNFPSTVLYNEGWMLRLVLDWLSRNPEIGHDLAFTVTDKWYSEALIPSAFLPRVRGDNLAESWTHADGVIGDFVIGKYREGDLSLVKDTARILVTEAKMFSKLSSGVKNAKYFNQAARNVACIAELFYRAKILPSSLKKIGFFVIAPESQINDGVFAEYMTFDSIRNTVERRISDYQDPDKEKWFRDWFLPTLKEIQIREISWEDLCNLIHHYDSASGLQLQAFYEKCLEFNQNVTKRAAF